MVTLNPADIVGELTSYLSALNGELAKFFNATQEEVELGWVYSNTDETKALQLFKKDDRDYETLEKVVEGFNTYYRQWIMKHGCHANFIWTAVEDRHKRLEIAAVDYPVFRRKVESERLSEYLKEQTMKGILGEEGESVETRNER